ncbi:MAG: sulfite exporter TauE/SafE family protein [Candidatus Omnitrophota bacterium]|nr:MAG: sulfite exporter TauE/SafE family protein [Candidatus Omnitrophota bacterium]
MQILYLVLGIVAGIFSGFFGIGGGTILIPVLVYLLGLTQHQAQGTTLAIMIPPIGLLAAIKYYLEGNIKLSMAIFICIGFFIGALFGAQFAHKVSDPLLKKLFGVFLLLVSLKMIIGR